ncbi:MAG TPA: hypothetical protein VF310_13620, partial [Vicinamibacteria bacterium]
MSYAVLLGCVVAAAAAAGYAAGLAVVGLRARWQPPETAAGGPAFALRVLPGALALVASLALALPAFVRFE